MKKHRLTQVYISLIFFGMFIYGISNQAIGTLISKIITHYDIKMAQAGLLPSFSNIGNFAALFVITIFIGRINKMILMGASLLFYALSLYLISTAPPFGFVLASFALIGLFGATIDTLTNSIVADLMPNVSRSLSLLHGLFGLGALCGPIVIELFFVRLNWAEVYFTISAVYFIYLLIYAAFVKGSSLSKSMPAEKQERFGVSDMMQFFKRKRHILLWLTMFFYGGNQSILAVWIKRYVEIYLFVPEWSAFTLSAMWLGVAISRMIISPVIKASSLVKISAGNFISAIALAAGLLSASAISITAASFILGLGSGLSIPLIIATGCEWLKGKTAFVTMMLLTSFFIAYVLFPPLSGLIGDFMGIPWGVTLAAVCALFTAIFSGVLNAGQKYEN